MPSACLRRMVTALPLVDVASNSGCSNSASASSGQGSSSFAGEGRTEAPRLASSTDADRRGRADIGRAPLGVHVPSSCRGCPQMCESPASETP